MAEKEIKVIKKDELEKVVEEKPNIAFVGDRPLTKINAQDLSIKLPEDQSKPFYHKRAKFIIQHFPHLYKPVKAKGE